MLILLGLCVLFVLAVFGPRGAGGERVPVGLRFATIRALRLAFDHPSDVATLRTSFFAICVCAVLLIMSAANLFLSLSPVLLDPETTWVMILRILLAVIESGRVVLSVKLALVLVFLGMLIVFAVNSRFYARISERNLVWRPAIGATRTLDVHDVEDIAFPKASLTEAAVLRMKNGDRWRMTRRHTGYVTFLLALHRSRGDLFPPDFSKAFKSAIYAANGVKET